MRLYSNDVLQIIRKWNTENPIFKIYSSGTTGAPKDIILSKAILSWSAKQTAKFINPTSTDKIACCLPIDKVSGFMQLIRAMEWQVPIEILPPEAIPFSIGHKFTITSLTPYQLSKIIKKDSSILRGFRKILLGGGEITSDLLSEIGKLNIDNLKIFHTYGMTETASHIAIAELYGKKVNTCFTPFDGVEISKNNDDCLCVGIPELQLSIQTNDIVKLNDDNTFEVLGRIDNVINTGGIKIHPEVIEKLITQKLQLKKSIIISSKKDSQLGNRVILISEEGNKIDIENLYFLNDIYPYSIPKEVIYIKEFKRNASLKIDRHFYLTI